MRGLKPLLESKRGFLLLDGGMGTELEQQGFDVNGDLGASKLLGDPKGREAMKDIHQKYLKAGADIITDANYGSYIPRMSADLQISQAEAEQLILSAT